MSKELIGKKKTQTEKGSLWTVEKGSGHLEEKQKSSWGTQGCNKDDQGPFRIKSGEDG